MAYLGEASVASLFEAKKESRIPKAEVVLGGERKEELLCNSSH